MRVSLKTVDAPGHEPLDRDLELSRMPVLGEYIQNGEEWFEVKRVVHVAGPADCGGIVYAVTIVDPTREALRLSEWMESSPV